MASEGAKADKAYFQLAPWKAPVMSSAYQQQAEVTKHARPSPQVRHFSDRTFQLTYANFSGTEPPNIWLFELALIEETRDVRCVLLEGRQPKSGL